ncbi:MAG: preprotein translocase subunit SecA [Phycisphaerae bacterium]|nr:preprotein translocase subunit SecA [Phycisphaerae bacterium]
MLGLLRKLFIKSIGGTRNERIVRGRMKIVVEEINPLEPELRALSDEELLSRSRALKQRREDGASRRSILPEAFAMIREASRRGRNHRQFDVQLVAGMILDEGWIAEEATGEGKTIACYPAIYMAWLDGKHTHVVTTNDYLVQRDAEFAQPIFALLGMTVGFIRTEMSPTDRQPQYARDVTYGTNSEFGFDYLRDNMKLSTRDQVQGSLDFAIVDEVDNILIDEARTPLIISGPAYGQTDRYKKADSIARELLQRNKSWDQANRRVETLKRDIKALVGEISKAGKGPEGDALREKLDKAEEQLEQAEAELARQTKYYEVELDRKSAHMTHEGVAAAQDIAGVGSFYVGANMDWPHLMEQALRAHLVYEKDKDYVVQQGTVVIVDEFTGRLMEGRQWSDGLHQAVEAKERVQIKEETQTIATITLQNYFKLYGKLAGMTGTAMTEAGEFMKIYNLDVVAIPTHRPVNRADHNDLIFGDVEGKYKALVEEINAVSKKGRPVLVGTTSIEKSELLSVMLTRSYGVEHEVLNGRAENAAREADIVLKAGCQKPLKKDSRQMVGNVTIATNMAGRGTDIKLGPGVVYEKCRVPDDETLRQMGLEPDPLYPAGVNKCCIHCEQVDLATNCAHCFKPKLDPAFPGKGRVECPADVPCGLHIVGTERHEARRIDNQLRGRSGRQGDPGSSRFFLSLRDDLMSIFAGEWTLKVLGWLGLQGEVAIEDRRISKGVARAQRKVEERNFEMRKNVLEYDEIMDHQRRTFYSLRQQILEGRQLEGMVFDMVMGELDSAVENFLDGRYARRCIAEWASTNLQTPVRDDQIHAETPDDMPSLEADLRDRAKAEAYETISVTLGEYMEDIDDPRSWDLRGMSGWAMSRFGVNVSQNQLRKMSAHEVETLLGEAAAERIDQIDLSPLVSMLEADFAREALAEWARNKFDIDVSLEELTDEQGEDDRALARTVLGGKIQAAYDRRQIEYPVEHALEMTIAHTGTQNVYALQALVQWAEHKYEAGLTVEDLQGLPIPDVHQKLLALSEEWLGANALETMVRRRLGDAPSVDSAIALVKDRFDTDLKPEDFDGDVIGRVVRAGREFLRREMTELERFVLLQIFDTSWKDHLLAMDHLRGSIHLRGFAEQDPKVAYKREGGRLFDEMFAGIREKVADMIFKVRLSAEARMKNVYQVSSMVHEQLQGYDHLAREMADQQAASEPIKVETIKRDVPKVGRNDPCPCGSGKKYKKCCGRAAG